jgi:hypothetical protein
MDAVGDMKFGFKRVNIAQKYFKSVPVLHFPM